MNVLLPRALPEPLPVPLGRLRAGPVCRVFCAQPLTEQVLKSFIAQSPQVPSLRQPNVPPPLKRPFGGSAIPRVVMGTRHAASGDGREEVAEAALRRWRRPARFLSKLERLPGGAPGREALTGGGDSVIFRLKAGKTGIPLTSFGEGALFLS